MGLHHTSQGCSGAKADQPQAASRVAADQVKVEEAAVCQLETTIGAEANKGGALNGAVTVSGSQWGYKKGYLEAFRGLQHTSLRWRVSQQQSSLRCPVASDRAV